MTGLHGAGYLLGIATGKSYRGLEHMLAEFDLGRYFVTLQTSDKAPSKPHPGMVEQAVAEAGVTAQETVVVGDTSFDMEMAVNAGARAIGVGWGYHEADELHHAGALTVIDSFGTSATKSIATAARPDPPRVYVAGWTRVRNAWSKLAAARPSVP